MNEGRVCYRFNDAVKLPIPHTISYSDEHEIPLLDDIWEESISAEELIDKLIIPLTRFLPERPAFEVATDIGNMCGWYKNLCMTGLIEREYVEIMDLYQICSEYKTLPDAGGVLDQEPKLMEIFQVLKAEEIKFEKIRLESETKGKK